MLTEYHIRQAFRVLMGTHPREADVQAILALGATEEVLAEYIWDHWLGEPDEPTVEDVLGIVKSTLVPPSVSEAAEDDDVPQPDEEGD